MRHWRLILALIAVVSFGVALYYPISYRLAEHSNNTELESLSQMRAQTLSERDRVTRPPTALGELPEGGEGRRVSVSGGSVLTAAGEKLALDGDVVIADGRVAVLEGSLITADGKVIRAENGRVTVDGNAVSADDGGGIDVAEGVSAAEGGGLVIADGQVLDAQGGVVTADAAPPTATPEPTPSPTPGLMELILDYAPGQTPAPFETAAPGPTRAPTPTPSPTPNRYERTSALAYPSKEKVLLDEARILPELREIYEINRDLVGWISIPGTVIDYPVVQSQDREFYLKHDFYGKKNSNGQIILDEKCDPYTPSYNLIISGHRMNNGSMFAGLAKYQSKSYWQGHMLVQFDTLMARGDYVAFAAFYSADYDEHEEGFRYNADIQYRIEAEQWLEEIRQNQIYDTGIDVQFGDEFITLTTCNYSRRNGRFVLVCRKLREGERIE